jgi:hypothetical protein
MVAAEFIEALGLVVEAADGCFAIYYLSRTPAAPSVRAGIDLAAARSAPGAKGCLVTVLVVGGLVLRSVGEEDVV